MHALALRAEEGEHLRRLGERIGEGVRHPGVELDHLAGGEQIAIFRLRDGSLHATQAACPHAGGPLADGQTDLNVLVCPLHLYAYRWSDGASTGGAAPIRTYPVRERDGYLVVDV